MIIRLAEYMDLFAINEIYNQAIDNRISTADLSHITIEDRIKWFDGHNSELFPILVAEIGGEVVGWISLSPYRKGREGLKANVEVSYYIHNDYQKQGIASKLMAEMICYSRKLNYRNLFAILIDANIGSIKLLEKFSFQKWAFLPEFVEIDGNIYNHVYYGLKIR